MSLPIVVFWACVVAVLRGPPSRSLYVFFAGVPFASFAVLPPGWIAGLTLTPAPVIAILMILRCLSSADGRRWFAYACLSPSQLGPLFMFWLVAAFTTLFAPLFFAGQIAVIPMRAEHLDETVMLQPTLQQFSQLGYLSVSVFAVVAGAHLFRAAAVRQHALRAMAYGALILCMTGLLDWATQFVDVAHWLAPVRNASYAIALESETLEMRRVIGATPEPAVFGGLCVSFLAALWFFRRAMSDRWLRGIGVQLLCLAMIIFIYLSTSTTAYVGLAVFVAIAVGEILWRFLVRTYRGGLHFSALGEGVRFALAVGAIALALALVPGAYERLGEMIDTVVLKKTDSGSFDERSMWTRVSLESFFATSGFGVGLGGTRASNSFVAMLSNTGGIATAMYVLFLAVTWLRRPSGNAADGRAWLSAFRWCVPVMMAPGLMSGTTADFGPWLALLFGSTLALQIGARSVTDRRVVQRRSRASGRSRMGAPERRRAGVPERRRTGIPERRSRRRSGSLTESDRQRSRVGKSEGQRRSGSRSGVPAVSRDVLKRQVRALNKLAAPVRRKRGFMVESAALFDLGDPDAVSALPKAEPGGRTVAYRTPGNLGSDVRLDMELDIAPASRRLRSIPKSCSSHD